jgi:hypothetical protein
MTTQGLPLGASFLQETSSGGPPFHSVLPHMKPPLPPKIYLTETSQGLPQWVPFLSGATSGHLPTSGLTPQLGLPQMGPPFPKGLSKGLLSLRYSLSPLFLHGLPLDGFHCLRGYLREGLRGWGYWTLGCSLFCGRTFPSIPERMPV